MKASPAALSITSVDIRMNRILRRTRRPISPSANKIAARRSPSCTGIIDIGFLQFWPVPAEMIGGDQRPHQQHRGQLDPDQVRSEEDEADLLRTDALGRRRR